MSEYCLEIGSLKRIFLFGDLIVNFIFTPHRCFKAYLFYKDYAHDKRIGYAGYIIFKATSNFLQNP